jgi:hypothetical protein
MTRTRTSIDVLAGIGALALASACGDTRDDLVPVGGNAERAPLYTGADLSNIVNHERAPISVSWPLGAQATKRGAVSWQQELDPYPTPHVADSRGYWFRVTPADLVRGVALPLSAADSFIKLSPQGMMDLELDQLVLVDGATGAELRDGAAVALAIDVAQVEQAGIPMIAGSLAFRTSLGVGVHTLRVDEAAVRGMTSDVVIQVEEPGSRTRATLAADQTTYLLGDTLTSTAAWDHAGAVSTRQIVATLHTPSGATRRIDLSPRGAGFTGATPLTDERIVPGALIDVVVDMVGVTADGVTVRRTVKTAAGYALPTAALRGGAAVTAPNTVEVGVEVGSPGRYAVTGVVYGTDAAGDLIPFMMAQSARFLEPGAHTIALDLSAEIVADAGLRAPFEIRDLRLQDQTRLGVLHREAVPGIRLASLH